MKIFISSYEEFLELRKSKDFVYKIRHEEAWIYYNCPICNNESRSRDRALRAKKTIICKNCLRELTLQKLYGVKNNAQRKDVRIKLSEASKRNSPEVQKKLKILAKERGVTTIGFAAATAAFKLKYGVDNPSQVKEIKEKATMSRNLKIDSIKEKTRKTCLERYGTNTPAQNSKIKEKMKKTCLERFGVDNAYKAKNIIFDIQNKKKKYYFELLLKFVEKNKLQVLSSFEDYKNNKVILKCLRCGKEFQLLQENPIRCEDCFRKYRRGISRVETDFANFIKILYKDNIHRNSKREIWPYELDILTTINVAFEVDGLFWHSSDKNPLRKHLLCESKNIKLYRIFDTLWNIKQDIMKSIFTRKILEEPCDQILVVKPITYNNTIDFIKNYSLTPYKKSCLKLGLFLKETLVAILTGRHKNDYLYITNICPATNIFFDWLTPLLKTLCDKNLYIEIDRRLFYGSSLIKNNFKIIGYTKPKTLKYDSSAHDIPSNVGSKTILDCGSIILERRVK